MVAPIENQGGAPGGFLRQPPPLVTGDKVALFYPSSHSGDHPASYAQEAQAQLTAWGLRVEPLPEPEPRHLYLAGTDEQRAGRLQRLYQDPEIKALFAGRGGYGASRLLPLLDGEALRRAPPKWVVGMSDITALFAYLHTLGLGGLHGPCLAAPLHINSPHRAENVAALHTALFAPATPVAHDLGLLHRPPGLPPLVRAPLLGGCLAVLAAGVGTPWALDPRGAVLFLEDVDEAPYRVDRYLTQLAQAGRMEGIKAVILGHFKDCDGRPPGLLARVLKDLFANAPFPVLTGLPAGHGALNLPLPLGRQVELELGSDSQGGMASLRWS
ncbi:MAG: LD-carboxypeptidase [Deltaproteobacteria bacterium]|nr:LD-carboxypeptidase [Deltaproteobacteria bacterium]